MQRTPLLAFVAVAALMLAGCASNAPVVQTDHAPGVDFAQYHTYTWVEEPQAPSPITRDKLIRAIDGQFSAKGLQRVPSGGDLALVGHLETREDVSYQHFSVGVGVGGWGSHSGGGVGGSTGTSIPISKLVGALALDLYDAKTKQALWRATVDNVPQAPDKVDATLASVIPKMFAKFPPPR